METNKSTEVKENETDSIYSRKALAFAIFIAIVAFLAGLKVEFPGMKDSLPALAASGVASSSEELIGTSVADSKSPTTVLPASSPARTNPVVLASGPAVSSQRTPGTVTTKIFAVEPEQSVPTTVGLTDLEVQILDVGVVDKVSGYYTSTSTIRSTDRTAFRFVVKNVGTRETGSWHFNAALPTYPFHIYVSESKQNIKPGDHVEFTLGFDGIEKADGNTVVINIDPANSISEANEKNNVALMIINGVIFK